MKLFKLTVLACLLVFVSSVSADSILKYTANSLELSHSGYVKIAGLHLIEVDDKTIKFTGEKYLLTSRIGELTSPDANSNVCLLHAHTNVRPIQIVLIEQTCQKALKVIGKTRRRIR